MLWRLKYFPLILLTTLLFSCSNNFQLIAKDKIGFNKLEGWHYSNHYPAFQAFTKSCEKFATMEPGYRIKGFVGRVNDWNIPCKEALRLKTDHHLLAQKRPGGWTKDFFEDYFAVYKLGGSKYGEGLFTGYYEALLHGSRRKRDKYQYPIYRLPDNINRLKGKSFFTRELIEDGALRGKNLEIVYVDDPVELFFLHVQGSGRVHLDDGSTIYLGYNGKNGHGYTSIGRKLVDRGEFTLEEIDGPKIKQWLYDRPQRMNEIMNQNESYVFFREVKQNIKKHTGPIGSQGVDLTAEGSIAIDNRYISFGTPLWVDTQFSETGEKYQQLLIAQDTGGAIKGLIRGDIFFGFGKEAEQKAGIMKGRGTYYMLIPKTLVE